MAGSTEGQNGTTASQHITNPAEIVKQARHSFCHARLFDAKMPWIEVAIRDAVLVVKCWRCKRFVGFRPE
jgi:hypothetical protein